jgi:LuxR family maltose regulon positive regulatory protein
MSVDQPARRESGQPALIETKLTPPRDRSEFIVRPRLIKTLDELGSTPLTLIDAPLGYGKTVLAQTWCAMRPERAVAWLSLDVSDDDPVRLWTYIATSVDRIRRGLGSRALARLQAPAADVDEAINELVNGMSAYGDELVVVLDDLQALSTPALESIERVVDWLPANARLLGTSRYDPPISLARLRGRGLLGELRAQELAFTTAEAHTLLVDQQGLPLESGDVELLVERTEGWPAALYLALLWLRTHEDPQAAIRSFSASHRHVAGYLSEEVLDLVESGQRDFLIRSSVLPRFTAELCDEALGREDSASLLAELERSNLFLIPLDSRGEWFRYHHLFGELLQLELSSTDPAAAARIHGRASSWLLERGLVEEAVEHAFATGDEAAAAQIVADHYRAVMETAASIMLVHWVERLSSDALLQHPDLAAAAGLVAAMNGRPPDERRRLFAVAERARTENPSAWTPEVDCMLSLGRAVWRDGDAGLGVANGRRAAELAANTGFSVPAVASFAQALFFAGNLEQARAEAQRAVDMPEAPEQPYARIGALALLALIDFEYGRVAAGEHHALGAGAEARAVGIGKSWTGGLVHLAQAALLTAKEKPHEAEREAMKATGLLDEFDLPHTYALLVLAQIRIRRGLLGRAAADLAEARAEIDSFADAGRLAALAEAVGDELDTDQQRTKTGRLRERPTGAELKVLRLLATDLSAREIGTTLFVSVNTVRTHIRELYRKLDVNSRAEAVARAGTLGLLGDNHAGDLEPERPPSM